ncbi:exo-alpha-(1-_6)-L-arabinopyranosidase [Lactobacillaceae bacterium]|nr:exo-alpha-(1->6)-L-arabinopyranosidase [Lactobacillaceae bacterium]
MYPFGYGLSYTEFDWDVSFGTDSGSGITADDTLEVSVTVKNTGDYAGKDVVELYYSAPYDYESPAIEKSHVVLGDFAKTDILAPGEEQTLTLTLDVEDMKSYDYADANENGFSGYELEAGEYRIIIGSDAHTAKADAVYTLSEDLQLKTDMNADGEETEVANAFDDVSAGIFGTNTYASYVSRKDFEGTLRTEYLDDAERTLTDELKEELDESIKRKYTEPDAGKPWEVAGDAPATVPVNSGLSLRDMLYDEAGNYVGEVSFDDPRWETLLNEISLDEMKNLVGFGAFRTSEVKGVDGVVGKPLTVDSDGPSGFTSFLSESVVYGTCAYQAECVMGSTWNVQLAEKMGELIGEEGLAGNEKGDGLPYSGWYAPAVNIHRSPFAGRNWEYYSEDGLLSGKFAAGVIKGAGKKGVYCYVKHFAVNDQETDREYNGILVWANEQSMREIYLYPFEIAVKEGGATGMMSSFNRLGMKWAGGSYALLTQVLRDEWGFHGSVITDYSLNTYTHVDEMIRAGGDLFLTQDVKTFGMEDDATQIAMLRQSTKNILYMVANSSAMSISTDGYLRPVWQIVMICVDIVIVAALALWGMFAVRSVKKKEQQGEKA